LGNSYPLDEIMNRVDEMPPDVEELLLRIFDSISDQAMAYRTIAIIQAIREHYLPLMSVFRYSFLNEYVKDSQFAMKIPLSSWTDSQRVERVEKAGRWLIGRCKCLFEVVEEPVVDEASTYSQWRRGALALYITVAHRTVYDFLRTERIRHRIFSRTSDFNPMDAICQTFLAEVKTCGLSRDAGATSFHGELSRSLEISYMYRETLSNYIAFIDSLDTTLLFVQDVHNISELLAGVGPGNNRRSSCSYAAYPGCVSVEGKTFLSVMYLQCDLGAHEYVIPKVSSSPDLFVSKFSKAGLGVCATKGTFNPRWHSGTQPSLLDWLLEKSFITANDVLPQFWISGSDSYFFSHDVSLWLWFLERISILSRRGNERQRSLIGQAMGVFLAHGADPVFSLELEAKTPASDTGSEEKDKDTGMRVTITHGLSYCTHIRTLEWRRTRFVFPSTSDAFLWAVAERFVDFVIHRGGKIDLMGIIDYIEPDNADMLKKLVDERLQLQSTTVQARVGNEQLEVKPHGAESTGAAMGHSSGGPGRANPQRQGCEERVDSIQSRRRDSWIENPVLLILTGKLEYTACPCCTKFYDLLPDSFQVYYSLFFANGSGTKL
jgi:hypothetical protein